MFSVVNKYWFNKYNDLLLNNQVLIFCELSSSNENLISVLKKKLNKEGFSFISIKNGVFKSCVKGSNLENLVQGPLFIIYKDKVSEDFNLKIFFDFIDLDCILCCVYNKKIYNFNIFKYFKSIKMIEDFFIKSVFNINTVLNFKLQKTVKSLITS